MGSCGETPEEQRPTKMPHICGPHSNLPNCRYFDKLTSEQNPDWVPAAGTGTMDKQKRFPRPQMTHQWEPQSHSMHIDEQKKADGQMAENRSDECTPKTEGYKKHEDVQIPIKIVPAVTAASEGNWAGKNLQAEGENIFPRKRRSDLKPQM